MTTSRIVRRDLGGVWELLCILLCGTYKNLYMCGEFPGGLLVKNPPCNVGDVDSIPGWETKIPHPLGS